MRKHRVHAWRTAALVAVMATLPGLLTCDHASPESLFIIDAMAMSSQNQCVLRPGQSSQVIRPFGDLDLMVTNYYWLFPHFRNMMEPINSITGEGSASPEAEVHYISVQRAKTYVDLGEFASGSGKVGAKYQIDGVESFVAAGAAPQGEAAVAVHVIPPELGAYLEKKMQAVVDGGVIYPGIWVTVYVTLYGQTQDGNVISSNEFSFPVRLCWGCMVSGSCSSTFSDLPCYPGQDEPIPALLCPYMSNHPSYCPQC